MTTPTFFTHEEIVAVISDIKEFQNFLLLFFGNEYLSTTEQINFDRIEDDKRIAVFVNPRRPGEVIKQRGFKTVSYRPGYIKDKRTIDVKHVFRRRPGQAFNAAITPELRYAATVVDLTVIQVQALYRRLELMASQLFLNGTYNMTGDDIDVNVDFDRKDTHTVTLAGANRWGQANVSPIESIDGWLELLTAPCRSIIFGSKAWKAFKKDPIFNKQVDVESRLGVRNFNLLPEAEDWSDVVFRGILAGTGIRMYTYVATYTHPDTGTETKFVPDDAVMLLPNADHGYQCFATIQDAEADYTTVPYYMKNWIEHDPGIPYLLLQSAPMLAHTKINSTMAVRTGAA